MSTKAIEQFLMRPEEGGAYTDERLAALLAHAEDGKLKFFSCCCFAGIPSAQHALQGNVPHISDALAEGHPQYLTYPFDDMSYAFCDLARTDDERTAKLVPLIRAEMARRESLATHNEPASTWDNNVTVDEMKTQNLGYETFEKLAAPKTATD